MFIIAGRYDDEPRHDQEDEDYDRPRGIGSTASRPVPVDVDLTGDEAYQRRLAMSAGFQRAASPKPTPAAPSFTIAGRASSAPEEPEDDVPSFDAPPPPSVPPTAATGEEAYLRRLAMSQPKSEPVPRVAARTPEPPALAYNPFAPTASVPPPSAAGLPSSGSVLSEEMVKSRRETAAAIAAKLAALKPPQPGNEGSGPTTPTPASEAPGSSKK